MFILVLFPMEPWFSFVRQENQFYVTFGRQHLEITNRGSSQKLININMFFDRNQPLELYLVTENMIYLITVLHWSIKIDCNHMIFTTIEGIRYSSTQKHMFYDSGLISLPHSILYAIHSAHSLLILNLNDDLLIETSSGCINGVQPPGEIKECTLLC